LPSSRHSYTWWAQHLDLEGRQKTADGFKAQCPSHGDAQASLHVTRKGSDTAPAVVHCFAGCDYDSIVQAASGITTAPRVTRSKAPTRGEKVVPVPQQWKGRGLAWWAFYTGLPIAFVKTLPIGETGDLVTFTFPHNGICKQRVVGSKQYTWNKTGIMPPPLWPMPEDVLEDTIYLTEGESDASIARYMGLDAYGITKGANSSLSGAVWRLLRDRGASHVVLMFDQDEAGEKATDEYTDAAIAAGLSVSTIRPVLHILEGEKDLRDWFKRTHGEEPLLLTETQEIAFDLTALAASVPPTVPWVAEGYFAKDALTLVSGPPKSGKSTLIFHFLACHENEERFLGEDTTRGTALLMTEEAPSTVLEKADAYKIKHLAVFPRSVAARAGLTFPDALDRAVRQARREGRDVLIIDTLSAWAQFKDENDASEVTKAVTAVQNAVAGTGISVIVIHHTRKGGGEYGEAVRGSSALYALVDVSIEYGYKDPGTRTVTTSSRFAQVPEPLFVKMPRVGHLEIMDRGEQAVQDAGPIIALLEEGPKTRQELEEALNLSDRSGALRDTLRELERLQKVSVEVGDHGRKTYTLQGNAAQGGTVFKVRKIRHLKVVSE